MSEVWKPGNPLVLETQRFILKSLGPSDATETYISWWNDAEIQEGMGSGPRGWEREQAVKHIGNFNNKQSFHLGIFPRGEKLPIGFFAIFLEPGKVARTNILVGNKDYWGKTVPLEVRTRVLDFLFKSLNFEKVYGKIHGRNYASVYNYKALGFTPEGVQRAHVPGPDGKRLDILLFGLLRDEWLNRDKVEDH
jgi:RimJ/RimL family protein N-acetyltransferase